MCPSSWKLYVDDFPFFWFLSSSSRTRAKAVWSLGVWELIPLAMMMICRTFIAQTSNSSSSGSRRAREEPKTRGKKVWRLQVDAVCIHDKCYCVFAEEDERSTTCNHAFMKTDPYCCTRSRSDPRRKVLKGLSLITTMQSLGTSTRTVTTLCATRTATATMNQKLGPNWSKQRSQHFPFATWCHTLLNIHIIRMLSLICLKWQ